ncbi:MAG: CRISPR system precrRNA processing endoribonuclease RAMP protein Cas6 [Desulfobacteria bacterium]
MDAVDLRGIKVGIFDLSIEAKEPIILPAYKGSTLRGGFGNAFKKIVCVQKERDCSSCILKGRCIYSYVFETPPKPDTEVMRKYESVPHPFIIEPPSENRRNYKPGDGLTFGLTLVGKAIDFLPYFIYTFEELGRIGIGKGRGQFELKAVHAQNGKVSSSPDFKNPKNPIYTSATKKLTPPDPVVINMDIPGSDGISDKTLTLRFLTPTRISYNGHITSELEFHILIRNLLRRVSLLSYFHCGIDTSAWDFKGIIERAKEIKTKETQLRWYDWKRYSSRQDTKIGMGGFLGEITFGGDVAPFFPLIMAGEVLHVGKGTSFGLGRYEMRL